MNDGAERDDAARLKMPAHKLLGRYYLLLKALAEKFAKKQATLETLRSLQETLRDALRNHVLGIEPLPPELANVLAGGLDAALAGELASKLEKAGGGKFALFMSSVEKRRGERNHGAAELDSWRIATKYRRLAEAGVIQDAHPHQTIQEAFRERDGRALHRVPDLATVEKWTGPKKFPEIVALDLVTDYLGLAKLEFDDRERIPSWRDRVPSVPCCAALTQWRAGFIVPIAGLEPLMPQQPARSSDLEHEYDEALVAHVIYRLAAQRCAEVATGLLQNAGLERSRKFPNRARHALVKPL